MKLGTISLNNFCQHASREFQYLPGVTGVTGSNASGKSNLVTTAPLFALTGKAVGTFPRTRTKDALITEGQASGSVSFTFTADDGLDYCLTRRLDKNEVFLRWLENGEAKELKAAKYVEPKLEELLGLPLDMIEELCFVRQGKLTDCLELDRSSRILYFQRLLGLQRAEKLREHLQKKLNELPPTADRKQLITDGERAVAELTAGIATQQAALQLARAAVVPATDVTAAHVVMAQADGDALAASLALAEKADAQLRTALADLQARQLTAKADVGEPLSPIASELLLAASQAKQIPALDADLNTRISKLAALAAIVSAPVAEPSADEVDALRAAVAELAPKAELARTRCCPTCRRPFELDFNAEELLTDFAALRQSLGEAEKKLAADKAAYQAYNSEQIKRHAAIAAADADVKSAGARLAALRETALSEIEAEIVFAADAEYRVQQPKLVALRQIDAQVAKAEADSRLSAERIAGLRSQLTAAATGEQRRAAKAVLDSADAVQKAVRDAETELAKKQAQLQVAASNLEAVKAADAKDAKLRDVVALLSAARDVLHMDKLPSIPLRRVRTHINRAIGLWLARFGGTLTAELNDDFEFVRTDRADQSFSGGEAVRLSVAFHLAKIDLLAGKLPLLVLDEPTHNLDSEAQGKFCDIIRQLQTLAGQKLYILVVTHEENLLGSVSRVVRVEKQ